MTHALLPNESNQARNERLQAEYDAYVADCVANKVEPTNYINWSASKKYHERNQQKGSSVTAEEIAAASAGREDE